MKKIFLTVLTAVLFILPCAAEKGWVKVEGNKFVDPHGNELVFHGLCFSDPVKLVREGQWNERYFAEAADWGANVVRFAVHPTNLNMMGWEETFAAMDQGIQWAKEYGMYVIMDWHSIGNLKEEKYTSPMYNTTKAETLKFWAAVAERYKDEPTVALYELFNEPTVTAPGVGTCSWTEWKALQEEIIDTIRAVNPHAVCLCAGFNWAYDLTPVAKEPIDRPNVAYVSHPYPMKRSEPWEEQWEKDFGYVADTYPVICTEIGYCLEGERGAHVPVISTDEYGKHITRYFEQKGISFTVWCFDTSWAPTLISDWEFTPTTQGRFFKAYLQGIVAAEAGEYGKYYRHLPVSMQAPMLPDIPRNRVSIKDFGAKSDGVTDNTEAFEKAIAELSKRGGGHLEVPAGIWLTGPIALKDHIDLHLEKNAIVLLTPDRAAHLKNGKVVPGISASKCTDISITGEGIIDGNGEWWRGVKRGKVSDTEWNAFRRMGGTVTPKGDLWYPFDLKNFGNIADTYEAQEKLRTHLVRFTDCERILVQGVTLQNSPKFHLVPQRCKDVVIKGVTVRCPWNAQNGDGIDIGNCKNVLIVDNVVDVGDDGICMKGGAGEQGLQYGPCENILVENNTVFHAHGGFVIGSEFSGGMRNIVVRRNTFSGTDTGLRFKSAPERGGKTENIWISDIYMSDIQGEAVVFETTYADRPVGNDAAVAPVSQAFLPDFGDIRIDRVTCRDCRVGVKASGTLQTIHDITLTDCLFFYTEEASQVDDPGMLRLENVRFETYR